MSRSAAGAAAAPAGRQRRRAGWRRGWKWRTSAAVCALLACSTLFPDAFTAQNPLRQDLAGRLRPPIWVTGGTPAHPFGTDSLGRDVLARVVYGIRLSVPVAVAAVAAAGAVGTSLGVAAGYFGGAVDLVVVALADFMLSFPFMLTALLVAAVLGGGLLNIVLVLAVSTWPTYARIARAEAATVRRLEFIDAARAIGAGTVSMLRRHVLPNIAGSLIVIATLEVARLMIAEAFLSFLGVGIPSPLPSLGGMIADGRTYLIQQPWLATIPGAAIMMSASAFNLLGDVLRDRFDPRQRHA